jgi:plastocyanin
LLKHAEARKGGVVEMRMVVASLVTAVCLLPAGEKATGAEGASLTTHAAVGDAAGRIILARRGGGAGGGADEPVAQQPLSPPVSPPTEGGLLDPRVGGLEVGLGEWAVTLEADTIRPGPVTFVVKNRGTRAHGFRIRSTSGRGRDRFQVRSPLIQPGGEGSVTADLAPGTYRVDCYVTDAAGDHAGLGMRTMLTVQADAPLLQRKAPESAPGVSIAGFSFAPTVLRISVGTTVTWTNNDPTPHTITADDGSFESREIKVGGTFGRTFDRAGTFSYHCTIHPSMQGKVEVGQ